MTFAKWATTATFRAVRGVTARLNVDQLDVESGPVLFIGTHTSLFDVVAGTCVFDLWGRRPRLMIHARYFSYRPARAWLHAIEAIPVDPSRPSRAIKEALAALDSGDDVLIMPEGRVRTADATGLLLPLAEGAGLIAVKSGRRVVAMSAAGVDEVWPSGRRLPRIRFAGHRPMIVVRHTVLREVGSSRAAATEMIRQELLCLRRDCIRELVEQRRN